MLAAFSSPWDHPRSCGAHPPAAINITGNSGSSPLMRGSLHDDYFSLLYLGLTCKRRGQAIQERDHPRACGAHTVQAISVSILLGSSPRMRGSPFDNIRSQAAAGIIPAHAGLTFASRRFSAPSRDHPRACGAHSMAEKSARLSWGSSPRVRGSPSSTRASTMPSGIIPAHAGLTCRPCPCCRRSRDHPRACGAHTVQAI